MLFQQLRNNWEVSLLIILTLLLSVAFFVGYQGMDDNHYVYAADQWVRTGFFVGENHWHNRLPLVLSIALSFQLFGKSELSLVLPNIIIFTVFVAFYYHCIRQWFGRSVSNIASLLLITTPLFSTYLSIAYPVVIETCFVVSAYFLFLRFAFENDDSHEIIMPILAGALLGIAFLNRQTAAAALIALLPIFLMSLHYWKRWLISGITFTIIVGSEFILYWYTTGRFFNRMLVDVEGHKTPSFHLKGGTFEGSPLFNLDLMSRWVPSGTFDVHWLVNPYLDLFTTASYGFLFWIVFSGIFFIFKNRIYRTGAQNKILLGLLILAAVWFIFSVYVLSLRPQARYFGPMVAIAAVPAALGLRYIFIEKSRALAISVIVLVVISNLVLGSVRKRPLELEREVAELVSSTKETVYMPQPIYDTSKFFLDEKGVTENIAVGIAPAGKLHLVLKQESGSIDETNRQNSSGVKAFFDASGISRVIPPHLLLHLFPERLVPTLVKNKS